MSEEKKCICPEDGRQIRRADRVYVLSPRAQQQVGNQMQVNMDEIQIFHKDCPVHGYKVLSDE